MLTVEEKEVMNQAFNVYLQVASQQMPEDKLGELQTVIGSIFTKCTNMVAEDGGRPEGITEEWFKEVCQSCEELKGNSCSSTVTAKFPGKCDPILKFERERFLKQKAVDNV